MRPARSVGTAVLACLAVLLLTSSLLLPWFGYTSSSGRRTPPAGLHDVEQTREERHTLTYSPYAWVGDTEPADPAAADAAVQRIGHLVVAATAFAALAALLELPGLSRAPMPLRWGPLVLAMAAAGGALWLAWTGLPATLAPYGVDGPFTSIRNGDTYVRTTLLLGWVGAAMALPFLLGAILMRLAAGVGVSDVPDVARALAERRRGGA